MDRYKSSQVNLSAVENIRYFEKCLSGFVYIQWKSMGAILLGYQRFFFNIFSLCSVEENKVKQVCDDMKVNK